jgi:hypothetical protein
MNRATLFALIAVLTLTIVACSSIGLAWYADKDLRPDAALKAVVSWFDPQYVGYNLMLLLFAVLVPPLLAISYTSSMCEEKTRRMRNELGALWEPNKEWIGEYIDKQFRWRDYLLGVAAMSSVVAFGGIVLLLLKPINSADAAAGMPGLGLDFAGGANLLLLGPYVEHYGSDKNFHMVVHSLTAFAFGFLGAYIYSIGQLIRGYFTVDLSPSTFVSSAMRIIVASCTALVAAFGLSIIFGEHEAAAAAGKSVFSAVGNATGFHPSKEQWVGLLPVIGFFFGYFPNRALKTIASRHARSRQRRRARLRLDQSQERVGHEHQPRLPHGAGRHRQPREPRRQRADRDRVAHGVPVSQVKTWVGEARLRVHLGRHFIPFVERTGICTYEQLCTFAGGWHGATRGSVYLFLADTMRADGERKKRIASKLEAIVSLREIIDGSQDAAGTTAIVTPTLQIRRTSASSIQAS